jgi:succinate dehydrogenase / fumarate reductase, flavoprotein subunit
MGGIPTDIDGHILADSKGTIVPGLYAVGECACVSVHGANRLGCNSLIDLVVFGKRTGETINREIRAFGFQPLPIQAENIVIGKITHLLETKGTEKTCVLRENMQQLMTNQCSVFRNAESLQSALLQIRQLKKRYANIGVSNKSKVFNYELEDTIELGNMLRVAEVIVYSAINRTESRGAHYRNDYPQRIDEQWLRHTLVSESLTGLKEDYKPVAITMFSPEKRRY